MTDELYCILTCAVFIAAFAVILVLCWIVRRQERENEAAEIREMLRQDKRHENTVWEITTRVNDDRADLFRRYAELEVD
jgi:hypothetical protein